jgi:transposase
VSRRARRAKTDRLDAEHLWRLLWRYEHGEQQVWHVVHVPSPAVEDSRHHERLITTLTREVTRWRNRLHGLLATTGVRLRLVGDVPAQFAAARDWAGQPLPPGLQARARHYWAEVTALTTALTAARQQQRAAVRAAQTAGTDAPGEERPIAPRPPEAVAAQIMQLQGVGIRTAVVLAKEVFSRDLQNRRQVGALSGLTPTPYASGETHHEQGISRAGLARVRGLLVELAWQWVRRQPDSALTAWFLTRFGSAGRRPRKVGIVALARRLLIALWRYSRFGEVPAGAVLRAA